MRGTVTNVLFVSTENACRSLLAEACLNHLANRKLRAFSCGVPSKTAANPLSWTTLALATASIPKTGLTCKSWVDFSKPSSVRMDFVIGLNAAIYASHPACPGQPVTALWDYPAVGNKNTRKFDPGIEAVQTLLSLHRRIEFLVTLHSKGKHHSDLEHDIRDLTHV
jgi:protein-tyrosine-phosphatase